MFISAKVSLTNQGLKLEPIALIFQSGETRHILQPWIAIPQSQASDRSPESIHSSRSKSPISDYLETLQSAIEMLWIMGFDRTDQHHLQEWQKLIKEGETIGFYRLLEPIRQLSHALDQRSHHLSWDSSTAWKNLAIVMVFTQILRAQTAGNQLGY